MTNDLQEQKEEIEDGLNQLELQPKNVIYPIFYINRAMLDKWQSLADNGNKQTMINTIFNDIRNEKLFKRKVTFYNDDYYKLIAIGFTREFDKLKSDRWKVYGVEAKMDVDGRPGVNKAIITKVTPQYSPYSKNRNLTCEELALHNKLTVYLSRQQWKKICEYDGNTRRIFEIINTFPQKPKISNRRIEQPELETLAEVIAARYQDLYCKFIISAPRKAGWVIRTNTIKEFIIVEEQK